MSLFLFLSFCLCLFVSVFLCLFLRLSVSGELFLSTTIRRVCTYVVSHFSIVTFFELLSLYVCGFFLCVCVSVSVSVLSFCVCLSVSVFVSVFLCLSLCLSVSGELILSTTIRRVCTYVVSHFSIVTFFELPSLYVCVSVSVSLCPSLCCLSFCVCGCVCLSGSFSVSLCFRRFDLKHDNTQGLHVCCKSL